MQELSYYKLKFSFSCIESFAMIHNISQVLSRKSDVNTRHVFTLFFLAVLFLLPSVVLISTVSAAAGPSAIVRQTDANTGYEIYSPVAGTVVKTQATWNVPTVNCAGAAPSAFMQFYVVVGHIAAEDSGTQLVVTCNGTTPQYSLTWIGGGFAGNPLPAGYNFSPGDKMQTSASVTIATGATKVTIRDLTLGWLFTNSSTETIDKTRPSWAWWFVAAPGGGTPSRPLLQFSQISVGSVHATVAGHSGTLGSFGPLSKFTIYKYIFRDSTTMHVLAKESGITSTSKSFSITWVQGS